MSRRDIELDEVVLVVLKLWALGNIETHSCKYLNKFIADPRDNVTTANILRLNHTRLGHVDHRAKLSRSPRITQRCLLGFKGGFQSRLDLVETLADKPLLLLGDILHHGHHSPHPSFGTNIGDPPGFKTGGVCDGSEFSQAGGFNLVEGIKHDSISSLIACIERIQ